MVNAEVSKTGNESALAVIRKFSRRVQGTGLIQLTRKRRYFERASSKAVSKKRALKRIKRGQEIRKLIKEGKLAEYPTRRGRHQGSRPQTQSAPAPQRFSDTSSTPIAR